MTVDDIQFSLSSSKISEYMAFDQLKDEKYMERIKAEIMTEEERNNKLKSLFGFK